MKHFILLWSVVYFTEAQVVAQQNGYQLTQQQVNQVAEFVSFLIGQPIPQQSYAWFQQEVIKDFRSDPAAFFQGLQDVNSAMQQLYQLQNPIQLGLARSMLLAQIYPALVQSMQQTGQSSYLLQMIDKYSPIIVIDQQSALAFTDADLDGFLTFAYVYADILGQPAEAITPQQREQIRQVFQDNFPQLDLQTKQILCVMGIYGPMMQQAWNQLTPQQKQQLRAQMQQQTMNYNNYQQQGGYQQGGQLSDAQKQAIINQLRQKMQERQMLFNTMQNIMNMNNVTNLNIIENIGGSGGWWELNDY